jgi:hypothetical protein
MFSGLTVKDGNIGRSSRVSGPTPSHLKQAHRLPLVGGHTDTLIIHSGKSTKAISVSQSRALLE